MTNIAHLREWIGRHETLDDVAAAAPLHGLAALLDHESPPWPKDTVPPLAHWLYFLPRARQSEIDVDGHARRGGFLPPVDLPRRMFAGSTITLHAPIAIGASIRREATILDLSDKHGSTGRLLFVKVKHEIYADENLAISEEQDIVYRERGAMPTVIPNARNASRRAEHTRTIAPDAPLLFRFSALTFNAHRIHYDRDYACEVEYYPGLVVQGPFVAVLLLDHLLRVHPEAEIKSFSFRAKNPLFDFSPFDLCLASSEKGYDLWARGPYGHEAMTAEAVTQSD